MARATALRTTGACLALAISASAAAAGATECSELLRAVDEHGRDAYVDAYLLRLDQDPTPPDTSACNPVAAAAIVDAAIGACRAGADSPGPTTEALEFRWGVACVLSVTQGYAPERAFDAIEPCFGAEQVDRQACISELMTRER